MDIDRKVKIEVLFKNGSMREKTCYCGCKITKLNTDDFTLDKCNNKECNFSHFKFDEYTKELKKRQRREEKFDRRARKCDMLCTPIMWGVCWPILIPLNIFFVLYTFEYLLLYYIVV